MVLSAKPVGEILALWIYADNKIILVYHKGSVKGALHGEQQNFSVALLRWNKENSLFIYLF